VVDRSNPKRLVLRRAVLGEAVGLVFGLVFLPFWCWLVFFDGADGPARPTSWVFWLFLVIALGLAGETLKDLVAFFPRRTFVFDGTTRSVMRDGKQIARFGDVARVQLRVIEDGAARTEYRLSLALKDGSKVAIAQTTAQARAREAAQETANLLGVELVDK